ncbi:helix-turn-helix transcriptional regulator [Paenibacillus nasutitermitis]|uniref:HTH-type transcriptional regulator YisR n=1 Tax=Paenibacillus nasutitermitis TaxID=1652958 RepID=A0A916ZBZ5_9BACL|nr:AraC family transcriptional regulator [Paenibacillus nasutitermitis]GGD86913.1 putative HTH-type transcriptional regulator YisR [Paenibacillus nasutitermitis]
MADLTEGITEDVNTWYFSNPGVCGKAVCEPEWRWDPPGPMEDYDIWYVMEGQGAITINGTGYDVKRGTLVLLYPGDVIKARHDPEDRLMVIYIHFLLEGTGGLAAAEAGMPRYMRLEEPQWLEMYLLRVLEVDRWETKWKEEEFNLLLKLIMIRLMREMELQQQETPVSRMNRQRIQKVTDYMRQHIRGRLTPSQIGEEFQCSPRYLSRLFKQYTGISLKEYITRVRMERATVLLCETSMTITQIAEAVGYSELFYFSKLFKHIHGVSPQHFRYRGVLSEKHSSSGEPERS